jgi:hypothetical protein
MLLGHDMLQVSLLYFAELQIDDAAAVPAESIYVSPPPAPVSTPYLVP